MAAKEKAIVERPEDWPWVMLSAISIAVLFLVVAPAAFAQQNTTDTEVQEGTVESRTIIGLEQGGLVPQDPVMRVLLENQRRLEQAIFVLEDRIADIAALAQQTDARLARGDEPLVALEIEQLWVSIRSLEQENAVLREALQSAQASDEGG